MKQLSQLRQRICILGCSATGKSTLAEQLGKQLSLPVTHLDLIAHWHDSNWQRKTDTDLIAAHSKIIESEQWIIDGNYSACMAERLERATGVIWLDFNIITAAWRYIRRCLKRDKQRIGKLPGSQTEFQFWLLKHILFTYRKNRIKYKKLLINIHLGACIIIYNPKQLARYKKQWGINTQ